MKKIFLPLLILVLVNGYAQNKAEAYKIFNNKGKEVSFEKMIEKLAQNQIVLFGELHNNTLNHWLQLQTAKALYNQNNQLSLGAEMFETDDQLLINEYFSGVIKESNFEQESKLWNNYKTDYKPLLNFALTNNLAFIATNTPRRYASVVAKKGLVYLDSLTEDAKKYLPPLPINFSMETPGYEEMLTMMGGHAGAKSSNFVKAQALKDATMAYNINKNVTDEGIFLHFNGDFHSKNYGGIYWYLKQLNENYSINTIAVVESDKFEFLDDFKSLGDFIILLPEDMIKSY